MDSTENHRFVVNPLRSQNDTAERGLATVRAGVLPVLDSMIHHLLDRQSVGDGGEARRIHLIGLLDATLGIEVLKGVLSDGVDAHAALGGQGLVRIVC